MKWFNWINSRLKEPSTMAGLSVLATVVFKVPTSTVETVAMGITGFFSALAVLIPEKKNNVSN